MATQKTTGLPPQRGGATLGRLATLAADAAADDLASSVSGPSSEPELTDADWEEIKRQALDIVLSKLITPPDVHLSYIRKQISGALS